MDADVLKMIIADLEELWSHFYLAKGTRDKRSREKNIREAKRAISDYASGLPSEVLGYLDTEVAPSALNYQWVEDDIGKCIKALKVWMKELSVGNGNITTIG